MPKNRRRTVKTRFAAPRGGHPMLWGYGYTDLALLLGTSEGAVRQAVLRGSFDPGDLASVFAFFAKRQARKKPVGAA